MIEHETLLFPDTGPEFLRPLRTAALYSGSVTTLTFFNLEFAERLVDACMTFGLGREERSPHSVPLRLGQRLANYFAFVESNYSELQQLHREGLWKPVSLQPAAATDVGLDELNELKVIALRMPSLLSVQRADEEKVFTPDVARLIDAAFEACPPSYGDLILMGASIRLVIKGEDLSRDLLFENPDTSCRLAYLTYLLTLALLAERRGATPVSWNPIHLDVLAALRRPEVVSGTPIHRRREAAELRLVQVSIERHLPRVDDIPIAEMLELRQRRAVELEAFRVGVRALATGVDVTKPPGEIEQHVRDLAAKHVDPAVRDLNVAITTTRLQTLSRLGTAWKAGAAAVVPTIISFAAGAPLQLTAAVAAATALGGS